MSYKILVTPEVKEFVSNLDEKTRRIIKNNLKKLEKEPWKPRAKLDIKKLKGSKNPKLYRLRIGDYRAIYAIQDEKVRVTEIIRRSKGYSFLE